MTEQQYIEHIKSVVLSSLKVEYAPTLPNKCELEEFASKSIIKLLQTPELFNQIAEQIKIWSYYQAESLERPKKPEIAKGFLNSIIIRDFTVGYIKKYEEKLQKNQITR